MSATADPAPALWQTAFDTLSAEDKRRLTLPSASTTALIENALELVKKKQQECLDKRWKLTRKSGKQIIIRELWEKAAKWIQKFKEVGDIAVQYDTSAVSLPWAAVRLVLQVSINDVEVFSAIAEGVEMITRSIARCAVYEALYLQNTTGVDRKEFERELILLYTAVLRYLARVAAYYGSGTASKVLSSLASSSGGTKEQSEEVLRLEKEVERFVGLLHGKATAQLAVVLESVHTDQQTQYQALQGLVQSFEQPILHLAKDVAKIQASIADNERQDLLRWLSPHNHLEAHQRMYQHVTPGTGTWFLESLEYRSWYDASSSALLWLRGIAGCGKSMLSSITVQRLLDALSVDPSLAPTASYYCSKITSGAAGQSALDIIRGLLKQLACHHADGHIHPSVCDEYRKSKTDASRAGTDLFAPSMETCMDLLTSILNDGPAIIVVDGVDEMKGDPGRLLLSLTELVTRSSLNLKVLVASRDDPIINSHLTGYPSLTISSAYNSGDIELFITTTLDIAVREKRLLKGVVSPEDLDEIKETLKRGASSMFLWVSLHIQQLCNQQNYVTGQDVKKALTSLPETLPSVFRQIQDRIEQYSPTTRQIIERVIGWLLIAERPLTISELLSSCVYNPDFSNSQLLDAEIILDLCSGFVVQDAGSNQLTFAHASIREYLEELSQYSSSRLNSLATVECLNCLLDGSGFEDDSDSDADSTSISTFHAYSTLFWARHCRRIKSVDSGEAMDRVLFNFIFGDRGRQLQYWADDVCAALNSGQVSDPVLFAELSATSCDTKHVAVFVASVYGLPCLLDKFASAHSEMDWDAKNKLGATPLYVSARYGHAEVVQRLMLLGASVDAQGGFLGSPLQAAAYGGHDRIVCELIRAGADPWRKAKFDSAVHAAIAAAHQSTVIAVLSECANDERAKPDAWLGITAYNGLREVVECLLTEVDKQDSSQYVHDVLQSFLYRRRVRAALDELPKIPNINAQGGHFGNALQAACLGGESKLVKKLLKAGADPNAPGTYGSPLKAACLSGEIKIVELVLAQGATTGHAEALTAASSRGNISMVRLLIPHCVESERDKKERFLFEVRSPIETALCAASKHGHSDIVKLLLDNGAQAFASRALEHALENHQHDVAQILFSHITEIKDYTRFSIIMCSVPGRDEWLNLDVEEELDTDDQEFGQRRNSDEPPSHLDTVLDRQTFTEDDGRSYPKSLGLDQPQGFRYLQNLLAVRGSAMDFASALGRGFALNPKSYPAPIELAAKVGNFGVVELLLDRGADLKGALQTAVYCRQLEIVRLIFQKRPDTQVDIDASQDVDKYRKEIKHRSALSLAVRNSDSAMVQLLLDYKAQSNCSGPGPSLSEALQNSDGTMFDVILQSTCKTRESSWDAKEQSAILEAVKHSVSSGNLPNLEKLLSATKILSQMRQQCLSLISYEATAGYQINILEYIYELTNPEERESLSGSVLLALVKRKRDRQKAERRPRSQKTCPQKTLENDDTIEKFLNPHVGSACFESGAKLAFEFLVQDRAYAGALGLLKAYPKLSFITSDAAFLATTMHQMHPYWIGSGKEKDNAVALINFLISQSVDVNTPVARDDSPLYHACYKGWDEIVFLLIAAGADVHCVRVVESEQSQQIVENSCSHPDSNSYSGYSRSDTGVSESCSETETEDNKTEKGTMTAGNLDQGVQQGEQRATLNLLEVTLNEAHCSLDSYASNSNYKRWINIIFALLENGLICQAETPGLITVFDTACQLGLMEDVQKLLNPATWSNLSMPEKVLSVLKNSSGLHRAASSCKTDVVRVLIDFNADCSAKTPKAADSSMRTPMQTTLQNRYNVKKEDFWDTIDMLIDYGPGDADLETCLGLCLAQSQLERAKLLLQRGVRVPQVPDGTSPLTIDMLLQENYRPLINFESLASTLVSYIKDHDRTHDEIMQRLDLLKLLNIKLPDVYKLFNALGYNHKVSAEEMVSLLDRLMAQCSHDVNATFLCKGCNHPINLLALALRSYRYKGLETILKAILDRGADVDCPGLPSTALLLTCRHSRYLDGNKVGSRLSMAKVLLKRGAHVHGLRTATSGSSTENLDQTPLMFAVAANNLPMVNLLIEHGADINRGSVAPLNVALRNKNIHRPKDGLELIDMLVSKGARTRQHDPNIEAHLDAALGMTQDQYKAFYRECFDCGVYERW